MENRTPLWLYLALLYGIFALISLLVYLSRGRPGFVKKKLLVGGMILTITGAMTACHSPIQRTCYARPIDPDYIIVDREGWLDNHTFQAIGSMHPDDSYAEWKNIKNIEDPQKRAHTGAKMKAIDKIIRSFLEIRLKDCKGTCDYTFASVGVMKEFSKPLFEGKIIREDFNEDGTCTILFRISERNLKRKVAGENVD